MLGRGGPFGGGERCRAGAGIQPTIIGITIHYGDISAFSSSFIRRQWASITSNETSSTFISSVRSSSSTPRKRRSNLALQRRRTEEHTPEIQSLIQLPYP